VSTLARNRVARPLRRDAGPAQDEAGDREHDQHADDRREDAAEVEDVVVSDAEEAGEDQRDR
jgi:hypothetical protein